MRRYLVSAFAVLLTLTLSSAFAAKGNKGPNANANADASNPHGKVVSVDKDNSSLVLSTGAKKGAVEQTIALAANVTIKVDGQAKTLDDIKPGEFAHVTLGTDGKATEVDVRSGTNGGAHHGKHGGDAPPASAPTTAPNPGA